MPGEVITQPGEIVLNAGAERTVLEVANTGDRPIQVGCTTISSRPTRRCASTATQARGMRLDIAAGTAVRFEPGQTREVHAGAACRRRATVYGFRGDVMGDALTWHASPRCLRAPPMPTCSARPSATACASPTPT